MEVLQSPGSTLQAWLDSDASVVLENVWEEGRDQNSLVSAYLTLFFLSGHKDE